MPCRSRHCTHDCTGRQLGTPTALYTLTTAPLVQNMVRMHAMHPQNFHIDQILDSVLITDDQSSVSGEGLWKPCHSGDDVVAEGVGEVTGQVVNWPIAACDKCLDNKPNESNLQHSSKQLVRSSTGPLLRVTSAWTTNPMKATCSTAAGSVQHLCRKGTM